MNTFVTEVLKESSDVTLSLMRISEEIAGAVKIIADAFINGNKLLLMGNGGSAADAQHIAGELVGRFARERDPLAAIALTTDTSVITAVANDYGFDFVFSRQVQALAGEGDVILGISTSGNSQNVINALETAREKGLKTIALLGKGGGKLKDVADVSIIVPSESTPRIQEAHITIGHIMCSEIEKRWMTAYQ